MGLLAVGICGLGCGIAGLGIAIATGKACESAARQPEVAGRLTPLLLLGCALAEATAIYCLLLGLLTIIMG